MKGKINSSDERREQASVLEQMCLSLVKALRTMIKGEEYGAEWNNSVNRSNNHTCNESNNPT